MTTSQYTLECSLEKDAIRTFKCMLVCLKQFGTELFLEASEELGVTLRTLNTQQSAFVILTLQPAFFTTYTVRRGRAAAAARRAPVAAHARSCLRRWRRERLPRSSCT
jgi:hypothetical protein